MFRKTSKAFIVFVTAFSIFFNILSMVDNRTASALRIGQAPYTWDNIPLGGGGFVTGIVIHPKEKDLMYMRTDVGGAFRWDPQNQCWIPLSDMFSRKDVSFYGIDGIALDPNNTDVVYVACGQYQWQTPSDVLKSTDRGKTWVRTNLNKRFAANEQYRNGGECIAVDPNNSNIVYVATHHEGVWVSTDAAATWKKVEGIPTKAKEVPRSVAFDQRTAVANVTQTIYVGQIGAGVYGSNDGGKSWSLLEGSPNKPKRMEVASDGILYVSAVSGGFKYVDKTWKDISPVAGRALCALSVDANDPKTVTMMSEGVNLYRTTDGGANWVDMVKTKEYKSEVPWWDEWMFASYPAAMVIDPHDSKRIYFTDFLGVYVTQDITATPKQQWVNLEKGHEELCVFTTVSATKGARLFTGVADMDGFRIDDLTKFPSKRFGAAATGQTTNIGLTAGIAICEEDPNYMVRVGGTLWNNPIDGNGSYSLDNGETWKNFKTFPTDADDTKLLTGKIAISAKKDVKTGFPTIIVIPVQRAPYVSKDNGVTWTEAAGLPKFPAREIWNWDMPLESDKVDPNKFYYLVNGQLYITNDGGLNWAKGATLPIAGTYTVKAMPKKANEVWVSSDNGGMFRSKDGGLTFKQIPNVNGAHLLDFGKNPPEIIDPTLFIFGKICGKEGVYRSLDKGETWEQINDENHLFGDNPASITGDRQVFGVVYIGTSGRGIFAGSPPKDTGSERSSQVAGIDIKINGSTLFVDSAPTIKEGRTLVPVRSIFEAFGAKVDWDPVTKTVVGKKGSIKIVLQIDNKTAIINNQKVMLDVPASIIDGRTMVPARFIAQSFGAKVDWDAYNQTVMIEKGKE